MNYLTPAITNLPTVGEKIKVSPSAETPVPRVPRVSMGDKGETFARKRLLFGGNEDEGVGRSRLNNVSGGAGSKPSTRTKRRTKSFKGTPGPDQKTIIDMLKKKAMNLDFKDKDSVVE